MIIALPGNNPRDDSNNVTSLLASDVVWVAPEYKVDNGQGKSHFDAVFVNGAEFADWNATQIYKALKIPVIGLHRMSKLEQHLYLTGAEIRCPEYYFVNTDNRYHLTSLLSKLDDDDQLVVKGAYGARGLMQFLVRKGALVRMAVPKGGEKAGIRKARFETAEPVKLSRRKETTSSYDDDEAIPSAEEPQVVLGGDKAEDCHSKALLNDYPNNWLITKRQILRHEYRVLIFQKATTLWCERHINLDHFQNNLSVGTEVSYYGDTPHQFVALGVIQEVESIQRKLFRDFPNAPFLSVDVYVTDQNKIGVFEFSGEFGFVGMDFEAVRVRALAAFEYVVRQNGGNV
jgi:hypothetical protein